MLLKTKVCTKNYILIFITLFDDLHSNKDDNKLHIHYINANIFKIITHFGLNIIMGINRIHLQRYIS